MREFRMSKGWSIFIYIAGPPMIGLFVWLLIAPFLGLDYPIKLAFFTTPIALAMIALFIIGILDTALGKLTITEDRIISKTTLKTKVLQFSEIKGFQIDENYINILPNIPAKKKIKISKYIGHKNELLFWLAENYDDLDQLNAMKEEQEILESDEFGRNEEERVIQLKGAKKAAMGMNIIGVAVAIWAFIFPKPYEVVLLVNAVIVFLSILLASLYKGLIRLETIKDPLTQVFCWEYFCLPVRLE